MTANTDPPFLSIEGATITLASQSVARQLILRSAGVDFNVLPAAIDEANVRAAARADTMPPADIAVLLAELKAQAVSQIMANTAPEKTSNYIIGCDQILVFDDEIMAKPNSLDDAKDQLLRLSGRQHILLSAVVLFRDGLRIWHHLATSSLTMRSFDTGFAAAYIRHVGAAALWSPGAYQIESAGSSLFAKIEGDHFDILGLPLLPLLAILREHGLAPVQEKRKAGD